VASGCDDGMALPSPRVVVLFASLLHRTCSSASKQGGQRNFGAHDGIETKPSEDSSQGSRAQAPRDRQDSASADGSCVMRQLNFLDLKNDFNLLASGLLDKGSFVS